MPASGAIRARCTVRNTGPVAGSDVVQLYAHDPVASVTRPVAQLVGFARVDLQPGAAARIDFDVPSTRVAFTDRSGRRVVEGGTVELWVGTSEQADGGRRRVELTGPTHVVTGDERRLTGTTITYEAPGEGDSTP